ncbi:MAG: nucleoside-diphosphate-sugar epimerase [Marinoscillum sp.]|jgi:nucleoside-diphosphate-sugar epimerase
MKRISILGSGWLGLPLAIELSQANYHIKASSRSPERLAQLREVGIEAHAYDTEALNTQQDTQESGFLQADILIINITSKNVEAFTQLIAKIEKSTIQQVLFISSTSVYQNSAHLDSAAIIEDDLAALKPCPLLEIEGLFQNNAHFNTSIIRFSGLIGYQRHPGRFFLTTTDDNSVYCKTIKNPDARVNMIHRDDCIAIINKLIKQNCWNEVFNACGSQHPTRRQFYHAALSHLGGYEPVFSDQADSLGKVISNQKVKDLLGYSFIYDDLLDFNKMTFN